MRRNRSADQKGWGEIRVEQSIEHWQEQGQTHGIFERGPRPPAGDQDLETRPARRGREESAQRPADEARRDATPGANFRTARGR